VLHLLDLFFVVFHTALTLFNLFGWVYWRTRVANLITLGLTAGSWVGLGFFYGFGYCPLTDWHWQVLYRLGERDLPRSYITYLIQRLLGVDAAPEAVHALTVAGLCLALAMSLLLNGREWRRRRRARRRGHVGGATTASHRA
jgi:hypothetical protein